MGEPVFFCLTHFVSAKGKGLSTSRNLHDEIANIDLINDLTMVGTDGKVIMTSSNGVSA